jgi:putative alpha-1,2-mannosidase
LQRLYVGSDIGQGYCGDEDNGEMSCWYILSSLGLYDLALGSGKYIMTSPLWNKAVINRDNNSKIKIEAPLNSDTNKYIHDVTLDGEFLNDVYIDQSAVLNGNHTLQYTMSDTPSNWGAITSLNLQTLPSLTLSPHNLMYNDLITYHRADI